ncbi:MAG: cellulase family glycosylhydrolase [Bacteroidota bacterium]
MNTLRVGFNIAPVSNANARRSHTFPLTTMSSLRRSLISFVALFLSCGNGHAQGFLHVSGKTIVDPTGQEFILRGIGLGGWLMPEGYMIQTESFANSPTEIRKVITDLVGQANCDEFFRLYRLHYVARRDIDSIARWGFNSIRLPMHYALFTPKNQPGVYLEEGFAIVDSLLAWCEANRLYLILDLHAAPGGQNAANISDYVPGEPSLWESDSNKAQTIDLWKTFAGRYATRQWIGGYDLLNETVWDLGPDNAPLRQLFIDITSAIRSVDTNHIIFIEGNQWATDFRGLTPAWDNNMVYSFHKYWNVNDQGSISGYLALRDAANRPLWLGESGENSNHWFTECVTLMEANKIGWSWWPHKKIESVAGPLAATKTAEYDYLLRYWKGQATRPTLAYAVAALNGQAANLAIERCTFHPDVIDAILRQPFSPGRRPFASHTIPGRINLTDYDYGKDGMSYHDLDFQTTGSGSWNNGGQYRNDGVDIERCTDAQSNGFNVGWTGTGEYLSYTVLVAQSGIYAIALRAAANQSGGKVFLRWDQPTLTPFVDIPLTGGWQAWTTVDLGQYQLQAGTHDLRLDLFFGGFNVNYLVFTLVQPDAVDEEGAPEEFALLANYPNPFNPATTITYRLPAAGPVSLVVTDLLGREVAALVEGYQDPGRHQVAWDAPNLATGMYVCTLRAGGRTARLKIMLQR